MPRTRRSTTLIPGPPAGGRTPYIDRPITIDGVTTTVAERILSAVRAGNYLETAASLAGVRPATIRDWLYTGNATLRAITAGTPTNEIHRTDLRFAEFAESIARAQAEAEAEDVARLQLLARGAVETTKTVTTQKVDADGKLLEATTRRETETHLPDGAAIRWRLERRHPARWQGTHRVELTGEAGGPVELTVTEKRQHLLDKLAETAEQMELDAGEFIEAEEVPA